MYLPFLLSQKCLIPSSHNYTLFNFRNKLSTSILGPSNKTYIVDGSLFNWDRETVLVFGGTDPHTGYGVGRNTGKDIYRFVREVFTLPVVQYHFCSLCYPGICTYSTQVETFFDLIVLM